MARNISEITSSLEIGQKLEGNYTEIKTDGTQRLHGTSTAWKDMIADLFGKRMNSIAGKVDYDWDENAVIFQPSGNISNAADRISGNQEINHEFKVGTNVTFKPHIHWFQEAGTKFVLTAKYRLQRNGVAKTEDWQTVTSTMNDGDDVFEYSTGTLNQLTRFPDITVTCGVSDTIQFQIARTDSLSGNMLVYFFDLHGEIDSFGSETEIGKD